MFQTKLLAVKGAVKALLSNQNIMMSGNSKYMVTSQVDFDFSSNKSNNNIL